MRHSYARAHGGLPLRRGRGTTAALGELGRPEQARDSFHAEIARAESVGASSVADMVRRERDAYARPRRDRS
ncbi:MAG TPA: hypothetical protein VGM91_13415 [Conexibacter sp.]